MPSASEEEPIESVESLGSPESSVEFLSKSVPLKQETTAGRLGHTWTDLGIPGLIWTYLD